MAKLGELVGTIDRALSVLERLGLWGPVAAGVLSGALLGWWSALLTLPGPVIVMCAIFGGAFGLWLYTGLVDLRRTIERPNYAAWDHVAFLTIGQAANLWAECEPSGGINKKAYPYHRMLKELCEIDLLEHKSEYDEITVDSRVLRSDLKALPAAQKDRPKFLFPEER